MRQRSIAQPLSSMLLRVVSSALRRMARRSGCRMYLGILFLCFLLVGIVGFYVEYPSLMKSISQINHHHNVSKQVTVQKGHVTYEQLQEPSIPIYKDFYFFNLTNYKEFADKQGGVKPVFEEIGPFSYREYRTKTLMEDCCDPDRINYIQRKIFHFSPHTTGDGLAEDDIICTINIPMVAAISTAKNSLALRTILKGMFTLTSAKLYICVTARELAWQYTDRLVEALHFTRRFTHYPSKYVNIQVNDSIYNRNINTIHTGVSDISKVGQFIQWNGLKKLKIWNDAGADSINGTEGFFFRPNLKKGDNLTAFVDDIQRSVDIVNVGTVSHLGLTALRYGITNKTFKSAFNEPENARWGSWCPDGLFFLGPTQPLPIPVYGSKPHFLDGDPRLLESVEGLDPDRVKHDTVIDVEPTTGINLNFQRQLQINVQVNKTDKFPIHETAQVDKVGFNGTDTLYFPVLYINEYAEMDQNFKKYLEQKGLKLVQTVPSLLGVFGNYQRGQ